MHEVFGVALDGEHVNRLRFMCMNIDDKAKIGGQVATDLLPIIAGIVGAHDVPMFLHEEHTRPLRVHGHVMHAVSHFGVRVWNVLRPEPAIDRLPGFTTIVGTESACSGDCDPYSFWIARIK